MINRVFNNYLQYDRPKWRHRVTRGFPI